VSALCVWSVYSDANSDARIPEFISTVVLPKDSGLHCFCLGNCLLGSVGFVICPVGGVLEDFLPLIFFVHEIGAPLRF
jgi:hypothetical protein